MLAEINRLPVIAPSLSTEEFLSEAVRRNSSAGFRRRLDNPICRECHALYRAKYPDEKFQIMCDGIFDERDYQELYDGSLDLDYIREIFDTVFWARRHIRIPDNDGNLKAFEARDYQVPILRCTARRKVDRMSRGLGKTICGEIEELHHAVTRKNYEILILAPHKNQAELWYQSLLELCERDEELEQCLSEKKQAPFLVLKFTNGGKISIFTAGSDSGRKANSVRTQSPRRVRLEEQDFLDEQDYLAVKPLLSRYIDDRTGEITSEFHGSSTPSGKRETYYEMCRKDPTYREFHYPVMVKHPKDWSPELEKAYRKEARTDVVYEHEYLAEFGDLADGLFRTAYIERAQHDYVYCECAGNTHRDDCPLPYNPGWTYSVGVDWNGENTGQRIRVIGYDPDTKLMKQVQTRVIGSGEFTNTRAIEEIKECNRRWHAARVTLDKGFGHVQDESLRLIGYKAKLSPPATPYRDDDLRLSDIRVIDFGANLLTNSLNPESTDEEKRETKPFVVECAQIALERGAVVFSKHDKILEAQLRAYRVKKWDANRKPRTFDSVDSSGDHDLTAWMLALLGFEMLYGREFQDGFLPSQFIQVDHPIANKSGAEPEPGFRHVAGSPAGSRLDQVSRRMKTNPQEGSFAVIAQGGRPGIPGSQPGLIVAPYPNSSPRNNHVPDRTSRFSKSPYGNRR